MHASLPVGRSQNSRLVQSCLLHALDDFVNKYERLVCGGNCKFAAALNRSFQSLPIGIKWKYTTRTVTGVHYTLVKKQKKTIEIFQNAPIAFCDYYIYMMNQPACTLKKPCGAALSVLYAQIKKS